MILALSNSIVDVINVLLLWLFAFIIFGIIGMTLFQGKLYRCSVSLCVSRVRGPSSIYIYIYDIYMEGLGFDIYMYIYYMYIYIY
jgi:hypothetical protein